MVSEVILFFAFGWHRTLIRTSDSLILGAEHEEKIMSRPKNIGISLSLISGSC
jgi:hypothetical protein